MHGAKKGPPGEIGGAVRALAGESAFAQMNWGEAAIETIPPLNDFCYSNGRFSFKWPSAGEAEVGSGGDQAAEE